MSEKVSGKKLGVEKVSERYRKGIEKVSGPKKGIGKVSKRCRQKGVEKICVGIGILVLWDLKKDVTKTLFKIYPPKKVSAGHFCKKTLVA